MQETYEEIRAKAQALANETGYDYGVERHAFGFSHFMLPRRENRFGHELRCEVVSCEDLARCKPGHGPKYAIDDFAAAELAAARRTAGGE